MRQAHSSLEMSGDSIDRSQRRTSFWQSWILLNTSWSSKWWYSTVHNLTAIIGTGVLTLPSAMAYLGWQLGTFALLFFIVLSLVCYWQIVGMHEMDGERFDRYQQLGQHVLGPKLGFWMIVPLQILVEIGVDTVYIIVGASSLEKVYELLCTDDCQKFKLYYWMLVFAGVQLLLSQLPHIASITWISVIAAVTAIGYSTIAWVAVLLQDREDPPGLKDPHLGGRPAGLPPPPISHSYPEGSSAHLVFGVFSAVGQIAFACAAGHNIAMEVQATIPSTTQRPSKVPMWNGVLLAYVVITFCYVPVALLGYWLYGNQVPSECIMSPGIARTIKGCHVLLAFVKPKWLIVMANLMITLHLCGTYQLYAMPLFDTLETFVEQQLRIRATTFVARSAIRYTYIGLTWLLAASFPFFGELESFFAGFAMVPTTYLIPSILWHVKRRPRPFSLAWLGSMVCIGIGILVMITSTTGGLRNLIVSKKSFFQ